MHHLSVITLLAALVLLSGCAHISPPSDSSTADLQTKQTQAAQGNAEAQRNLGVMYRDGQGVPQDYAIARQWFEKAAAQGDAKAQYNLAGLYYNGNGGSQDYVRAHMWWSLAAARSTGDVQKFAAVNRDEVAPRMTPEQIAEAQRLAQQCQAQQFKGC
jgi:TPR repeat protein